MERLGDVMNKLFDPDKLNLVEAHELRMMNKEWRSCLPNLKEGGYRGDEPWLLYHGTGSSQARLYDPLRNRRYGYNDLNFQGARVLGSNLGWVVAVDSVNVNPRFQHNVFLYNPFSETRFDLPVLDVVFPLPHCVVRYGVITSDPLQNGSYACLVAEHVLFAGALATPLQVHYLAKTNGAWDPVWNVTSIPLVDDDDAPDDFDHRFVDQISPSENSLSIRCNDGRTYSFDFPTGEWNISQTPGPDGMDLNRIDDLTIGELKARLDLPENVPTRVEIMGTKTDRVRVRNKFVSDEASTSDVDGVWLEVRL